MAISKISLAEAVLYYELVENGIPIRDKELWELTRDQVKSKQTYYVARDNLEKKGIIMILKEGRKEVWVTLTGKHDKKLDYLLDFVPLGSSPKLLLECMEWLFGRPEFKNVHKATAAAMYFWLERFYDFCFHGIIRIYLNLRIAQKELPDERKKYFVNKSIILFEMFFRRIRKYINILTYFGRKHPKEIDEFLSRGWIFETLRNTPEDLVKLLEKFVQKEDPSVYKRIKERGVFEELLKELSKKSNMPAFYCRSLKKKVNPVDCKSCLHGKDKECRYRVQLNKRYNKVYDTKRSVSRL